MLTAFRPIAPLRAVEIVEAAGISDARRIITDFAAADLVKSYALVIETIDASGERTCLRGASVPTRLWRRIIEEGAADDVWSGGTVKLKGSELVDGVPEVRITGIGFSDRHLDRLIEQRGNYPAPKRKPRASAPDDAAEPAAPEPARASTADRQTIPPGAKTVTVKQAMGALGLGRTKINELMGAGDLVRIKVDARTLITVESIENLISRGRSV